MDAKLQRHIQRYGWDRASRSYDDAWSRQLAPGQRRLLALAALRPGEQVVDIACGTGLVSRAAAKAVAPDGAVLGTDISGEMVAEAARRTGRSGLPLRFERRDAEALGLPDTAFDAALNAFGLMYVPDTLKALGEMRRVLRPGGRAVLAVWGARAACGWADIFPIVDARVKSEVCPLFFRPGTGDVLALELQAVGFGSIHAERMDVTLAYETAGAALKAAFAGGPVALAHARFDERTRAAVYEEYLASIAPFARGEGYEIPGEFVIASAVAL